MIKPTKKSDIVISWHLLDAKDQILGRLATKITPLLLGKGKPYFVTNINCGDHVVVINARAVKLSGRKEQTKKYYRYSGYPDGLRITPISKYRAEKPERIIEAAVHNMLPKNKLRAEWVNRLHVFADATHTYADKFTSLTKPAKLPKSPKSKPVKLVKSDKLDKLDKLDQKTPKTPKKVTKKV